ncbi:hypothetical protein MELA_00144 [Candidatus Methylomirabilis lanthanidiphila]|uniref:Uncharacterized protein n=1 Tax=Candidatus Methylomirabilis lanthanidiphila TaxID=2211376 RepID=A0A564ZF46_9BACT|nr:hypothetical protein [Candidatus Methylomirabilis lanthanidiphila]VUZ83786.1 hypothetical protein MELA_00144 [Candidatus Methylomirabilis lanthanidiphila]
MAIRSSREDKPLRLFSFQRFSGDVENAFVADGEPLRFFEIFNQGLNVAIGKKLKYPACVLFREVQDVMGIDGEKGGVP